MAEAAATLSFDPDALREKYREERDKRLRKDGNAQYLEVVNGVLALPRRSVREADRTRRAARRRRSAGDRRRLCADC